ncbi:cell division protein CrgA [Sinomonas humi]|uniref:cell division protein CrgA n=1 Tax=Sinomonas humi TaxID=1338436 RepID=UPI000AC563BC|nr:cell division protein CrgA [Sinomonas humi]
MPESTEKPEPAGSTPKDLPQTVAPSVTGSTDKGPKTASSKSAPVKPGVKKDAGGKKDAGAKKDTRKPKAKKRKKRPARAAGGPTPQWYKYLMFTFMVVGLLWIIVFYVTQGLFPVPAFGNWNILIGFGIAIAGFLMTLRWRG